MTQRWLIQYRRGAGTITLEEVFRNDFEWIVKTMELANKQETSAIKEFVPIFSSYKHYVQMTESYLELLIDLYDLNENLPMLKAMVAIQHNRLEMILVNGHLNHSFSAEQIDIFNIILHRG